VPGSKISLYSQQKFGDAEDNQWSLITLQQKGFEITLRGARNGF
jgi:hypothetical protein